MEVRPRRIDSTSLSSKKQTDKENGDEGVMVQRARRGGLYAARDGRFFYEDIPPGETCAAQAVSTEIALGRGRLTFSPAPHGENDYPPEEEEGPGRHEEIPSEAGCEIGDVE